MFFTRFAHFWLLNELALIDITAHFKFAVTLAGVLNVDHCDDNDKTTYRSRRRTKVPQTLGL